MKTITQHDHSLDKAAIAMAQRLVFPVLVVCACMNMIACMLADETADEMIDGEAVIFADEAGFEVLAELHPDSETVVRFTREPSGADDAGFAVTTTVIGPDGGAPYERLLAEHNATPLELFTALAPAGAEPPAELVSAHRSEARARGRDESVRRLDIGAPAVTPFQSVYCDSYSAFTDLVSGVWTGPISGSRQQFVDRDAGSHYLLRNVADAGYLTACNYDSNRVDTKRVLLCSRYDNASSGDTNWVCDDVWLDDGMRVYKSWGCEFTGSSCNARRFYISAAMGDPAVTTSFLGLVQLGYVF